MFCLKVLIGQKASFCNRRRKLIQTTETVESSAELLISSLNPSKTTKNIIFEPVDVVAVAE